MVYFFKKCRIFCKKERLVKYLNYLGILAAFVVVSILFSAETSIFVVDDLDQTSLLNPDLFEYLHEPRTVRARCRSGKLWMLTLVHSATDHIDHRNAIRQTWASLNNVSNLHISTVFLLGMPVNLTEEYFQGSSSHIEKEVAQFGDILQGRFLDTYQNLTYKNIMGLKWATENCNGAKFILKTDDDVFVNIKPLIKILAGKMFAELSVNTMAGLPSTNSVVHRSGRYAVPKSIFSADLFPEYLVGMAYLLSFDAARKLYVASQQIPFLSADDAFLGILRKQCAIRLHYLTFLFALNETVFIRCIVKTSNKCAYLIGHVNYYNSQLLWHALER